MRRTHPPISAIDLRAGAIRLAFAMALLLAYVAQAWAEEPMRAHLTPLSMFLGADSIVKGIILTLLAASLATWTVFIAKAIEIKLAKRRLLRDLGALRQHRYLSDAHRDMQNRQGLVPRLVGEAMDELRASPTAADRAGIEARIASRLDGVELEAGRAIRSGTGVLATIGSTAPFVGLFGTVWGIMNSFIGIAASNTTNLAVVAPGIAEALLATAVGLIAAIPAVVIYNVFARSIGAYRAIIRQCSGEIARMASRELARATVTNPHNLRIAGE